MDNPSIIDQPLTIEANGNRLQEELLQNLRPLKAEAANKPIGPDDKADMSQPIGDPGETVQVKKAQGIGDRQIGIEGRPIVDLDWSKPLSLNLEGFLFNDGRDWSLPNANQFNLNKVRREDSNFRDFDYSGRKDKPVPFKDGFQEARSSLEDMRTFDLPFGNGQSKVQLRHRCGPNKTTVCLQFQRPF